MGGSDHRGPPVQIQSRSRILQVRGVLGTQTFRREGDLVAGDRPRYVERLSLHLGFAASDGEGAPGHAVHPDSPADHSHHLQSLVGSPAPHSALLSIHHQPGLAPLKTARWETSGFKALLGRARDLSQHRPPWEVAGCLTEAPAHPALPPQ